MKKLIHSEAPWICELDKSSILSAHQISAGERVIAHVEACDDGSEKDIEEAKNNARLITMTPRMYSVLWDLVHGNNTKMGSTAMALRFELANDVLKELHNGE